MASIHISQEWKTWIRTNLEAGSTPESLVEIMVDNHFDRSQSLNTIHTLARKIYPVTKISAAPILSIQGQKIFVRARVKKPVIVLMENVLTALECETLIALAQQKLQPSTTVNSLTGEFNVIHDRSSHGTYFSLCETDFIKTIDQRLAALMNMPVENGEGIQILNYTVGAEYKAHFDYFDPNLSGSQQQIALGGNRVATLVMYLNDVDRGGETFFPKIGLSVTPQKGSAVYFENLNELGAIEPLTLHAGLPVTTGEKWIATKWVREREYA